MEIILASNSPRRKEILLKANINFKIKTSFSKEEYAKIFDEKIIKKNSLNKAMATAREVNAPSLVIGADTMVILDNVCLVKPLNFYEAFFMLKKLSNKTHKVITAHTVINTETKNELTLTSTSLVTFKKLSNFEIIRYLIKKKPLDKAGSYGIQDFMNEDDLSPRGFISKLEGSYYNVMGLDISLVQEMLNKV